MLYKTDSGQFLCKVKIRLSDWSSLVPENTIKKKTDLITMIIKSCYFDYRINKHFTCSRRVICVP